MPLWKIYHPVGAYNADDKQALAGKITDLYAAFMPRFYVGVLFQEVEGSSFYIGGKPNPNFVRIWVDHIARAFPDDQTAARFIDMINAAIAPWVSERGYDWEFHIDETPFAFWSIQGFFPPKQGTEDEKRWRQENRPSPRTHA